MSFVDRQSGRSMMIVLWTTPEQARRALAWRDPSVREAFSRMDAVSASRGASLAIWEVNIRV
jgi:hypothetical protein